LIDKTTGGASDFGRVDTPAACPIWDGERINLFRALAIGERVGKAGPDLSVRR
jgi:hypothetical protein